MSYSSNPNDTISTVIIRDTYGVPHVYANDTYDLFFGYGYAIATDRLFQMEMTRRTVLGTVSEVLGTEYLDYDKSIRSHYTPSSIENQYGNLPEENKQIFIGYADGMNQRIDEVMNDTSKLLPKQFIDFDFEPQKWTPLDVVMIFVGTMANRFSDFNTELDNLFYISYLAQEYDPDTAWQIFNQTQWKNNVSALTTVPNKHLPSIFSTEQLKEFMKKFKKMEQKTHHTNMLHKKMCQQVGITHPHDKALTSNCWLVGDQKTNSTTKSMLVNGPQFGWYNPGYVYEIGLHGAGFNLIGNTPFGYPAILFGHNDHIAWGSTAGLGDLIDIYIEKIRKTNNSYEYLYDGTWKEMEMRTETIDVKGEEPVSINIYSTEHGLVTQFGPNNELAASKKRTWEGHEVASLIGWIESTQAQNYAQWKKAAQKNALTINWYYADQQGNIGYIHTGKYPLRQAEHDWRLPVYGTGEMEWKGILPFELNPQVYNPEQGFIANWNNKPASYWPNPDMWWLLWGAADRVQILTEELSSQEELNSEEMWAINNKASFIDLNISYFLPFLEKAVESLDEKSLEKQAVNAMKQWDRMIWDMNQDDYYDAPAYTIFQQWLQTMLKNTFTDDLQDYAWRYTYTGYPQEPPDGSTNVSPGTKILYNSMVNNNSTISKDYDFFNGENSTEVVLESLQETMTQLTDEYNSTDINQWVSPVVQQKFFTKNFNGIPQASPEEELFLPNNMNRGTENHMVILKENSIIGFDVCPPGQNGFISSNGTINDHYQDQMDLYKNFELKKMHFKLDDVLENKESITVF
jgi:penicillin amidase